LAVLLIAFATTLILVLKADGLALAARTLPEGLAWVTAFDVATYLDVVALAALAALALRLRVVWAFVRSAASMTVRRVQIVRRRWSRRSHGRPRSKSPQSDDDGGRWAGAAFA
jgi:hypothetical protein